MGVIQRTAKKALSELRGDVSPDAAPPKPVFETVMPQVDLPGLNAQQVQQRVDEGKVNLVDETSSRSYKEIIRTNIFSLFNVIIFIAMVLVLIAGNWRDALFGFVIIINAAMGILTEVRSKWTLEKLKILVESTSLVRRDGQNLEVSHHELVEGDYLWLRAGEQIPADGTIIQSWGVELDESMLTGESRTVHKHEDDDVLSGTVVVSGLALAVLTQVGQNSYAAKLTAEAKVYKRVHSDLQSGINTILKFMMILVVPLAFLLIWSQMRTAGGFQQGFATGEWRDAVVAAVAGIVGMIPDGLILLTSLNFAVAVMKLARKNTLVSQLESVETLARVDSLNLDKTGTITDGGISLAGFDVLGERDDSDVLRQVLFDVVDEESPNMTAQAVLSAFADLGLKHGQVTGRVAFSSARKWSAAQLSDGSVWCVGAPEILLAASANAFPEVAQRVMKDANDGYRVLMLARAGKRRGDGSGDGDSWSADFERLQNDILPQSITPAAIVLCQESIRQDAKQTLAYFREQGVRIRIISGDNPQTVGAIAQKVELLGSGQGVRVMDARQLPSDIESLAVVLDDVDVLGRVLPEQKKAIVQALHSQGKVVAMTGDGVNDSLAIKEADLGIAMGNAAPATKSVASVILTDSKFSHLPDVVAEGRQVMANMERVASLFLTKTVYAAILAIGVVVAGIPFPYLPRHMSYIGALAIGFPAFILALAPNTRRYKPGFLRRVVSFSLPSGIAIGACLIATAVGVPAILGWNAMGSDTELQLIHSFSSIELFVLAICVLTLVCRPLLGWRGGLVILIAGLGIAGACIPWVAQFFKLYIPQGAYVPPLITVLAVSIVVWLICVVGVRFIASHIAARRESKARL